MEPLSVAIHSVANTSQLRANQSVVVFGAGPVGLLCMAVARALGAASPPEKGLPTPTARAALALVPPGPPLWLRPAFDGLRLFVSRAGEAYDEEYD